MEKQNADFETIWYELKQQLSWHQGFAIYFVVSQGNKYAGELKERLSDYARSQVLSVTWMQPETVEQGIGIFEQSLFQLSPFEDTTPSDKVNPVWLTLTTNPVDETADLLRNQLLSYLNKRRSRLENRYQGALFIELPPNYMPHVVEYAPDLWSIRSKVVILPGQQIKGSDKDELTTMSLPEPGEDIDDKISSTKQAISQLKQKLSKKNDGFIKRLLATELCELGRLYLEINHFRAALDASSQALSHFVELDQIQKQSPQSQRDLSIIYSSIGDIHETQNALDDALSHYLKSLEISRHLCDRLNHSLQSRGDLASNLEVLSNIYLRLNDIDNALKTAQESLNIRKSLTHSQVWLSQSNTLETNKDLSVALERIGDIQLAMGKVDLALQNFKESSALVEQNLLRFGESQDVLRDLAISFGKIADVLSGKDELDKAAAQYQECLRLQQQIVTHYDSSPMAIHDLSVSNYKLGELYNKQGKYSDATSSLLQSLSLNRRLRDSAGNNLRTLNDAKVILNGLLSVPENDRPEFTNEQLQQDLSQVETQLLRFKS